MKRLSHAKRRDANERDIVAALHAVGCSVHRIDDVDLIVGYRGVNLLLEVKDGSKPPSARRLTALQVKFRTCWRGQYDVVASVDDALRVLAARVLRPQGIPWP